MSTDEQDTSLDIQRKSIRRYAEQHGMEITASYLDEGRSGLTLNHRGAMKRLLDDVVARDRPFSVVLVYDVSRWGRFQDVDASAYYEYHCRLHGVQVSYVREAFTIDHSPMAAVLKSLKRAMAAEFSRELAVKTSAGQRVVIERGFQMGQLPCLGIARVAIAADGRTRYLADGERKARQSEHIRWVPGPPREVELVREIFERYASTPITIKGLAYELRKEGKTARAGRAISERMLSSLLESEALIGTFVWGRFGHEMRRPPVRRSLADDRYQRSPMKMEPILDRELWIRAQQKRFAGGGFVLSPQELIERLRNALAKNPAVGEWDLQVHGCPSYKAYRNAFGSLKVALAMAGQDRQQATEIRSGKQRRVADLGKRIVSDICNELDSASIPARKVPRCQALYAHGASVRVQVVFKRARRSEALWWVPHRRSSSIDWVLIVRMEEDESASDMLLVSTENYRKLPKWLGDAPPTTATRIANLWELIEQIRRWA